MACNVVTAKNFSVLVPAASVNRARTCTLEHHV
jgi:hypothetical protein